MLPSDVRGLYEAYNKVYALKFETILDELSDEHVEELTDDLIEEVVEEVFYECLEEGYDIDEVENVLVESLQSSLTLLNEVSDSYYDDAVKTGKAKAAKAKRAETIEKVKGAVKKVGSEIKRRSANAAVSAYAAGKMAKDTAKPAVKAAGKAALTGAGKVAGKVAKYARKAGEAVSAGYKEGSKEDSESKEPNRKAFSDKSEKSSDNSGSEEATKKSGSLRRAAGSLLKRAVKKVVGKAARAVAGTARGVHGLADKAAKRLGESTSVDEGLLDIGREVAGNVGSAIGRNKGQKTGIPGAGGVGEVIGRNRGQKTFDKITNPVKNMNIPGFNNGGTVKKLNNSYEQEGDMVVEQSFDINPSSHRQQQRIEKATKLQQATKGSESSAAGSAVKRLGGSGISLPLANSYEYEEDEIYDIVMEYILNTGHAENISEAIYIMTQMEVDMIASIVEETTTQKLARRASEKAEEPGAKTDYKPQGPGFKNPRSKASIMNQIASRAKTRSQHGVDSQYGDKQSEQPKRGGRTGRGSKSDRPTRG